MPNEASIPFVGVCGVLLRFWLVLLGALPPKTLAKWPRKGARPKKALRSA